jgi:hypothetical protein
MTNRIFALAQMGIPLEPIFDGFWIGGARLQPDNKRGLFSNSHKHQKRSAA